jgi:hypothetical protein
MDPVAALKARFSLEGKTALVTGLQWCMQHKDNMQL